jgi:hypothetical protein
MATVEVEGMHRLEVVINNTKPVVLTDLTLSLLAVGQQYETFLEHELPENIQVSSALLVREVRTGSIIFDLITQAAIPTIPLLWMHKDSLAQWCEVATELMKYLTGMLDRPPKTITKHDLNQWHSILEPVAKDGGSQMNFNVNNEGNIIIKQLIINSADANAAQNRIRKEIGEIVQPTDTLHRKQVMTWFQARFDPGSQIGNKVMIENISDRPLRVLFDDDTIRDAMFAQGIKYNIPWHELAYVVDVQIQTIEGKPKVATIMKFYPELTFNPAD